MPKISIIVPVYNVEKYISRCIDSILNQTFTDFDLILVDDGSPDNSGMICDEYKQKDKRIYVIHQNNAGLSSARNTGIDWSFKNSESDWITFIDSDDWIHPDFLDILYNAAINNKQFISVSNYIETDGSQYYVQTDSCKVEIEKCDDFYSNNQIVATIAWGKLYWKDLFADIRYPVGLIHEDEFTTYKLIFSQNTIAFVNEKLYMYFQNSEGITKSYWTIKHLVCLKAYEEKIQFFRNNNHTKSYEIEVKAIIYFMYYSILKMKENGLKKTEEYIEFLKKFRKYLIYYHIPLKRCMPYYVLAFPFPMKILYNFYKIFKK